MSSTADLNGRRIGVLTGSVYDRFVSGAYPLATVSHFDTSSDLRLAVSTGKVDAGLADEALLVEVMRTNGELAMFGEPVLALPLGVGFRKGNSELRDEFNRFLAEIKQNGVYADMTERWMRKHETQMPDVAAQDPTGTIVVGIAAGGLPFAAAKDRTYIGFDIEIIQRFAAANHKTAKFSVMPFGALIAANATGKVDMIAASIFITDERKERIDFSDPYFEARGRAFALRSNIADASLSLNSRSKPLLASLDDLKDKRIGVQLGTVYDLYAVKNFPQAKVITFNTYQEVTLAVGAGKVDAGLSDVDTLNEVMRADPGLVPFGKPLFSSFVAAGFPKQSTALRNSFNAFLKTTRENGVYADMVDRWMTKRDTEMPSLRAAATNGSLVIGMSSGGFPFAAVQNNELSGFDVELAKRFAASVGKTPKLVDQEFGGLIAAITSGKIDVIIADMFITDERQQKIDFSDPYFQQDSVAFTRRENTVAQDVGESSAAHGPSIANRIASAFYSNVIAERRYLLLWDGLKTTVIISVFATIFGTILGAVICYMRMSALAVFREPARLYIGILRGTPIVLLLMIIFYVVFAEVDISPTLVAVVAFGLNFAAYVSEMFRAGIESIDRGQAEAGLAMGFTTVQTFRFIVLPQMLRRILPVYKGEVISLVKMTSVVGYIAVQDLTKASDIIRSRTFDAFFPLIIVTILYFIITGCLMKGLEYLEFLANSKRAGSGTSR